VVAGYGYVSTHVGRAVVPPDELGVAHEDVTFTTADGLKLEGWYVPSRSRAAMIAFPGRKGPQKHTRMLVPHGYGVLLFDRRGEGESEGEPNAWDWGGDADVKAATGTLAKWTLGAAISAVKSAAVAVSSNQSPPPNLNALSAEIKQPLLLIAAGHGHARLRDGTPPTCEQGSRRRCSHAWTRTSAARRGSNPAGGLTILVDPDSGRLMTRVRQRRRSTRERAPARRDEPA